MAAAAGLLSFAEAWLWCGLATAAAFLAFGLDRIDPSARGAFVFRVMLIPGLMLIWPIVLWRWFLLATGRDAWAKRHRPPLAVHGRVWAGLAVAIPLIFIVALWRSEPPPAGVPAAYAPEQLSKPGQ